jgi:GNAT superfamily N-acetyltransferase
VWNPIHYLPPPVKIKTPSQALTTPVRFRVLASPPSRKVLLSLRRDAGWAIESSEIDKLRRPAPDIIWIAAERNETQAVIGLGRLQLAGRGAAFLSEFVVRQEHTGRGVGSALLKYIEGLCAASGVERLALQSVPSRTTFYLSKGFSQDPVFPKVLVKILSASSRVHPASVPA